MRKPRKQKEFYVLLGWQNLKNCLSFSRWQDRQTKTFLELHNKWAGVHASS